MNSQASADILSNQTKLKGNIGPIGIAMMVVATAAPMTVMAGITPMIIGLGNGPAAPMDAILVGIVMWLFSVGFVEMSKFITNAGAFYAYILKGMGRITGVGAASLAVVSYTLILIALEAYIGFVMSTTVDNFVGVNLPWWLYTIGIVAFVGFLGYRNIELSTKVLGVALCLEISVILILNLVVFSTAPHAAINAVPFQSHTFFSGSPGLGILFTVFGFIGFESTVVYREEAHTPEVTIPRATYIAIIFISVLYFFSFWATVVGTGPDKVVQIANSNAAFMYFDLIKQFLGKFFYDVTQLLLITSLFAVVLSIHNVVARYKYILGSCGVLMAQLGHVHEKHASPYIASFTQTFVSLSVLMIAAIIKMDPVGQVYTWGSAAGTLGYMVIVALACLAVIVFFARNKKASGAWTTRIAPLLGFLGLSGFLYLSFANLSALTGSSGFNAVNVTIIALLIVAFLVGSLGAAFMMLKAPARFQAILDHMS